MQVIVYTNELGGVSVCYPTGELPIEEVQSAHTPVGSIVVDVATLPDNNFFNAWELQGSTVSVNIGKAKNMAHEIRRAARNAEFAPLDIKATIPSEAAAAEAARQVIRDRYAAMQTAIDAASTVAGIKAVMPKS